MSQFQFHKGTIRTLLNLEKELLNLSHFNSIKVRLERLLIIFIQLMLLFQFHKGTIRTSPSPFISFAATFISIP